MFPNEDWWYEGEKLVIAEGRTEIRCPGKFNKLFLVLRQEYMPQNGMLMEIACGDCTKQSRIDVPNIKRALHYYDATGKCVTTKLVTLQDFTD